MDRRVTPPRRVTSPIWVPPSPCKRALTPPFFINLRHICKEHFFFVQWNKKRQTEFYEQMTSNPVFTKRNVQKANAYRFQCIRRILSLGAPGLSPRFSSGAKIFGHYHTLPSLYVCIWLVNTLTSTAPIGSPIICMWSPADICEQWERNLSFGSADVSGAGKRDEPLRTSAWEAI